jgi:hypothetical protein
MSASLISLSHAIAHSYKNRAEVERSDQCACFHCFARFVPADIRLWADSDDQSDEDPGGLRPDTARFRGTTAVCPQCEWDSVIGSASGYDLSDDLLHSLNNYWYGANKG